MKQITRMIEEANNIYPDGQIDAYYDSMTDAYYDSMTELEKQSDHAGDTLALFIVREIISLVDEGDSEEDNRAAIAAALRTAVDQMQSVIDHFEGRLECGTGCGACRDGQS